MVIHIYTDPRYSLQQEPGGNTLLGILPFFHVYGLFILRSTLIKGNKIVVMPKFEAQVFLQSIQDYNIKHLLLVPPLANFLVSSPLVTKYDLSRVERISCGGAPLSKKTEKVLLSKFKKVTFIQQGYGLTESTVYLLTFPLGLEKSGSCGKVAPGISAKVVDIETGKLLGPYKKGELHFKGIQIMKGYIGDIKSTNETIDTDGWLLTGDVGYYDEEGYFYIVDRIKELIKYKGFQVAPAELESLLLEHPKISDVAVVGLPDDTAGEVPLAFVVKHSGQNVTEEEIRNFVAEHVSHHKFLRGGVKFVEQIPRNSNGKIQRKILREMLKQQSKL